MVRAIDAEYKQALQYAADMDVKLVPYEMEDSLDGAIGMGMQPITLGKRILRTETAGFTAMAWIMYQLEE